MFIRPCSSFSGDHFMKTAYRISLLLLAAFVMVMNVEFATAADKHTQWKTKFRNQQKVERAITVSGKVAQSP